MITFSLRITWNTFLPSFLPKICNRSVYFGSGRNNRFFFCYNLQFSRIWNSWLLKYQYLPSVYETKSLLFGPENNEKQQQEFLNYVISSLTTYQGPKWDLPDYNKPDSGHPIRTHVPLHSTASVTHQGRCSCQVAWKLSSDCSITLFCMEMES